MRKKTCCINISFRNCRTSYQNCITSYFPQKDSGCNKENEMCGIILYVDFLSNGGNLINDQVYYSPLFTSG